MAIQKIKDFITKSIKNLQKYTHRPWYGPMIGLLAALDNIVIIIPNDGILISSVMLRPNRWIYFAISVTIGSALGALFLASLVEHMGLPWFLELYPNMMESHTWVLMHQFFETYGLLLVFIVALSPIFQQPAILLAAIANTSLPQLVLTVFVGRLIKFLIMAYVASHAPRLLSRMWGIKDDLAEVGIDVNTNQNRNNINIEPTKRKTP